MGLRHLNIRVSLRWCAYVALLLIAACSGGGGSGTQVLAPDAPTGLVATPGDASVALNWTASANATAYAVSRATTSGGPYAQVGTPTATSFSDKGLTNGVVYYYVVAASNSAGTSAESAQVSATPAAPVTIPVAPAGLVAQGANGAVTLAWDAVSGATGYRVYRATVAGGPYQELQSPTATSYTDATVTNGTTYYYVVTAYNSAGESGYSMQAQATPAAAPQPPATPANVQASGANGQVSLTWTASPGATGYTVERATASGGPYATVGTAASAAYTDTTVTNGTTYYYEVDASNAVGSSAYSAPVSATPSVPPSPPAVPANVAATAGNAQVVLAWTASSGASTYTVQRATASAGPYAPVGTPSAATYTDATVTNGTTYYYEVDATNTAGSSAYSAPVSATPVAQVAIPPAPTGLAATTSTGAVSLTWNASTGATNYVVRRSTSSGSGYVTLTTVTTTGYTDTSVVGGTTYYYVVGAVDSAGTSGPSNEVTATPPVATTIPAAPAIPAATAGNASVSLQWSAVSGAAGYRVYRATVSGGPYQEIAGPSSTSYVDSPLTNGTTYYYVVTAYNSAGESPYSPETAATPQAAVQTPATPVNVQATGANAQVSLTWTASPGATAYTVQRATSAAGPYASVANPSTASYTDTSVQNGVTYYYEVSASNTAGTSGYSAAVSATPQAPVTVPATPTGLAAAAGNAQVTLSWTASAGATSYQVQRATSAAGPYSTVGSPSAATYTDSGLTNGTKYYYEVAAANSAGTSANSSAVSATPVAPVQIPSPPTGVSATVSAAGVSLTWNASSGATSYVVRRSTTSGSGYASVGTPTANSYSDTTVAPGTTYYYVVGATDSAGTSAPSAQVTATTIPAAPSSLTATAGVVQVSLSWPASAGATSYNVKRSTTSGGPYNALQTVAANTYVDTAVSAGTTYYYVVAAADAGGASGNSAQAAATPTAALQPPAAPTNVTATGGNATVQISWTASTGSATGYTVWRGTSTGGPYTSLKSGITTLTYADTSAANGTTYYYVVSAQNAAGPSGYSAEANATPLGPPQVPVQVTATSGNSLVSLSWADGGAASTTNYATGYNVYRSTTSNGTYTLVGSPALAVFSDSTVSNGTTYYYEIAATNVGGTSAKSTAVSATPTAAQVTVTVTPGTTHPISPYIYGLNFYNSTTGAPAQLTLDRLGGNRFTAYNWTNNYSNAGSDYNYENDQFLSSSTTPAAAITAAITPDQAANMATMVTFQMQGLVANDLNTSVNLSNPPSSDAGDFKAVQFAKGSAFTTTPPASAPAVYMDEFLWNLNQLYPGKSLFGTKPAVQPVFAQLDNEPELWSQTHLEVQGSAPIAASAYITKSLALATALKKQFSTLKVFGPAHYGFLGLYNWNYDASENPTPGGFNWFADQYMAAVQTATKAAGYQLVDVYDFHWYPEATDSSGTRVTYLVGPTLSADSVQAIVQSPRSLWDPTYTENSYIAGTSGILGGPINLLPRLKGKLANAASPMGLSITEYNNGGSMHIAGTIAQADNLGAFGAQGLYAATFWQLYTTEPYTLGAFTAFRNFDGAGSNVGDTSVAASSSNNQAVTVYVTTDSTRPGRVVMVALNRSTATQSVLVTGQPLTGTAHVYQMTQASTATQVANNANLQPVSAGTQAFSGSSITLSLPALSVTTVDIH